MENVNKALEDALLALNMSSEQLYLGEKYTIIEFCQNYLGLSINETVKLSHELVNDMPIVYINEVIDLNKVNAFQNKYVNQPLSTAASAIGNRIRQSAQNRMGVGNTGNVPDPKAQAGWNNPLAKIGQGIQNAFNTKGAALRNSPMLKISDNAKGIDRYLAFPDLDLSRPGHGAILNNIKASLTKDGQTAEQINLNNIQRQAAQQAGQYAEISSPDKHDQENKKQAISQVLDQLDQIVKDNKSKIGQFSFMSPEELAAVQKQVTDATGQATQAITGSATDAKQEEADLVNAASTSLGQTPPAATANAPATSPNTTPIPPGTAGTTPGTTPGNIATPSQAGGFQLVPDPNATAPTSPTTTSTATTPTSNVPPMAPITTSTTPTTPITTTVPIDANTEAANGSEMAITPGAPTPTTPITPQAAMTSRPSNIPGFASNQAPNTFNTQYNPTDLATRAQQIRKQPVSNLTREKVPGFGT